MKIKAMIMAVLAVVVSAVLMPASAQQGKATKELVVVAHNISAQEAATAGKPRGSEAALPGDVMEYRLVFTNTKSFALKDVVFADPIPSGLFYVAETAKSSRSDVTVEYSIDNGASWSARPLVEVVEEGKKVTKPAAPEQYTNVRWKVTGMVAPGATVEAKFRTRVNGVTGPKK